MKKNLTKTRINPILTINSKIHQPAAQTMKQATLKSTAISLIIQPIPKFPTKPKITLLTKYCAALKALL